MIGSSTANLKEPMWSINQTYFANKLALIWLYLVEVREILEREKDYVSVDIKF